MSAKSLQKASILNITASKIRIKHPDLSKNIQTITADGFTAAGTTLTVLDNDGFADNDWMIIGRVGDNQTEAVDVNGAVTRGTSITITNSTKFSHELNSPVTKIYETQIKLYGAATDGGTGTLIATEGIEWDKECTEYTLVTTDTAYAYYYAVYYDGTTEGSASDYVPSTGLVSNSVYNVVRQALDMTDTELGEGITLEMCVGWADDCQSAITQFMYQDSRTGRYTPVDWDFELTEDTTSLSISENQNRYDISSLNFKYTASRSVVSCRIGDLGQRDKINPVEMDEELIERPYTEVATQAEIGDTSLVVDSNVEQSDTGGLYIGSEQITYTGKTGTTTFTGIPASGSGSITAQHLVDSPVWQNAAPTTPTEWTVFGNTLIFNDPPKTALANYAIKLKYYKQLTALTEASDTITIPFYNVFQYYIASRIEQRKGKLGEAKVLMDEFNNLVLQNAKHKDTIPKAKKVYKKYAV
jgi:hypothetical protein